MVSPSRTQQKSHHAPPKFCRECQRCLLNYLFGIFQPRRLTLSGYLGKPWEILEFVSHLGIKLCCLFGFCILWPKQEFGYGCQQRSPPELVRTQQSKEPFIFLWYLLVCYCCEVSIKFSDPGWIVELRILRHQLKLIIFDCPLNI